MRQLQVRLAALVGLLPLTVVSIGCDSESGRADAEVLRKVAEANSANEPGRIPALEAASKVDGASPVAKAHVHGVLGNAELQAARVAAATAATHAATVAQLLADLDRMSTNLTDAQRGQANLKQYEPAGAKESVATKLKEVSEGTDGVWIAPLASMTATQARSAELTAKITETEGKIAALNEQRTASLAEAERLQKESDAAQGQASVDLHKTASGKRKEAMDLAAQVDVLTTSLLPLRQDLAIAEGQQEHRTATAATFTQQGATLDQGWSEMQAASAQIAADAKAMVQGEGGPTASSVTKAGGGLATALDEYEKSLGEAGTHYEDAINHYKLAAAAAQTVSSDLTRMIGERGDAPEVVAFKSQQNTFTPASFNLQKGVAEQELAVMLGRKATLGATRATVLADLAKALTAGGFTAPAGTSADGTADAAKTEAGKATEAFGFAVETLRTVAEAGGGTTSARQAKGAATVALMLTEHGWSHFAAATGDSAAAKSHLEAARALRGELMQDATVRMPALPPDLAVPAAAPAAPGATPATAPSASIRE